MQKFHNILFVSRGVTDDTAALKQALYISYGNKAKLKALVLCPEFPKELADYKVKYEAFLNEQMQKSIQVAREALSLNEADVPVQIEIEGDNTPATRIIRHVLINRYDLIVKQAELQEDGKGFRALDMELLRKCPSPILLCRPVVHQRNDMRIAVAIDPESLTQETHDLSSQLLKISDSLTDMSEELIIIACGDFELEESLRHNPWAKVSENTIDMAIMDAENRHRIALESLIRGSGIDGKMRVQYIRGRADKMIPRYVDEAQIDILVMGTLARTGIPGFIIGNTAENIVQELGCSLLALKPNGFVSPVKAY